MKILGISAFYHDSAAALVVDGQIAAAAQEERFSRRKHDSRFPAFGHSVLALKEAVCGHMIWIRGGDYRDKPFLKFERLLETYLMLAPEGFSSFRMALPLWIREKLFQKNLIHSELKKFDPSQDWTQKLLFTEHHLSQRGWGAFYPSYRLRKRRCSAYGWRG